MAERREEPKWLTRRMLDVLHDAQLREHGGSSGIRDEGLVESALARPRQKWMYDEGVDLAVMAAAYGFEIVKNHGYIDGNKRTAFLACYIFIGLNGQDLDVGEPEVVATMESVASGRMDEGAFATWIRNHLILIAGP